MQHTGFKHQLIIQRKNIIQNKTKLHKQELLISSVHVHPLRILKNFQCGSSGASCSQSQNQNQNHIRDP